MSLFADYLHDLRDPHMNIQSPISINRYDFMLREAIGKTDDIHVPICSHLAKINRELPEHFCRVCNKDLSKIGGRWNDYLLLRHLQCQKPICSDCAKNNPDIFHLSFRRGINRYEEAKRKALELADADERKDDIGYVDEIILAILKYEG